MRVKKEKRNFWLSSEVDCMLNLIKEIQAAQGTTSTTHYTFVQIANKMKIYGYPNKSPTQIRRKWFQMKSAYLCYRRGNKDRLLLIPEKFRKDIAHFVEAEYRSGPKHANGVDKDIQAQPAPCIESNPRPIPVVKPQEQLKPKLPKLQNTRQLMKNMSNNDDFSGNYYQQKFFKFATRLRLVQRSLKEEFTRRQKTLMEYEHGLQKERDAYFMKSILKTTNLILPTSFSTVGSKSKINC